MCIMNQFHNLFFFFRLQLTIRIPPTIPPTLMTPPTRTCPTTPTHTSTTNMEAPPSTSTPKRYLNPFNCQCLKIHVIFVISTEFPFCSKTTNTKSKVCRNLMVHSISCSLCCKMGKLILCTYMYITLHKFFLKYLLLQSI